MRKFELLIGFLKIVWIAIVSNGYWLGTKKIAEKYLNIENLSHFEKKYFYSSCKSFSRTVDIYSIKLNPESGAKSEQRQLIYFFFSFLVVVFGSGIRDGKR